MCFVYLVMWFFVSCFFFFFKQKTAYEMRISDWSSDVCSSDLVIDHGRLDLAPISDLAQPRFAPVAPGVDLALVVGAQHWFAMFGRVEALAVEIADRGLAAKAAAAPLAEHEFVRGALQFEEQRLDRGIVSELLLLEIGRANV